MPQMSPLSWLAITLIIMFMYLNLTSNMQKSQKVLNNTYKLKKNENSMKW